MAKVPMGHPKGNAAARAFVALVISVAAALALFRPRQDFDLMAYVGVVHAYDTESDEEARSRTIEDLRRELSDPRFAWMIGRDFPDSYAHAMATDPRSFGQQLAWFRGRPLFTRTAWLLSKLGVSVPRALHLMALLGTVVLALAFYVGTSPPERTDARGSKTAVEPTRGWSDTLLHLGAWSAICGVFHLDSLAASPLADPLSSALVVTGLLLALDKGAPRAGLLVLVLSVLARSDNAMYAGALALFSLGCAVQKKDLGLRPREALFAAILSFALRAWVDRGGYSWAALVHFRRVHFETHPADVRASLDLTTYLGIVRAWALEVYACQVIAVLAFVFVLAHPRARPTLTDPFVAFAVAMVPLSVLRFLAFPDWDSRFFIAPLGFFFLGIVRAWAIRAKGVPSMS